MEILNKSTIITKVKQLCFPKNSYWLVMGAALVLHGIKCSTHDIDIGCTKELFEKLIKQGFENSISRSGKEKIVINDNISIYKEWSSDEIVFICGLPVVSLGCIIKDKEKLGRDKDISDINLIAEYLNSRRLEND